MVILLLSPQINNLNIHLWKTVASIQMHDVDLYHTLSNSFVAIFNIHLKEKLDEEFFELKNF